MMSVITKKSLVKNTDNRSEKKSVMSPEKNGKKEKEIKSVDLLQHSETDDLPNISEKIIDKINDVKAGGIHSVLTFKGATEIEYLRHKVDQARRDAIYSPPKISLNDIVDIAIMAFAIYSAFKVVTLMTRDMRYDF